MNIILKDFGGCVVNESVPDNQLISLEQSTAGSLTSSTSTAATKAIVERSWNSKIGSDLERLTCCTRRVFGPYLLKRSAALCRSALARGITIDPRQRGGQPLAPAGATLQLSGVDNGPFVDYFDEHLGRGSWYDEIPITGAPEDIMNSRCMLRNTCCYTATPCRSSEMTT